VRAEGLAVEEDATPEPDRAVEILLGAGGVEPDRIDAELTQEPGGNNAVRSRAVDLQRPPVHQLDPAAQLELVALRVPAKVVVIVEDENARRGLALAIEIGGRETADAAANDHEVVGLGRTRRLEREITVAELVRQLERPRMAAPEAGQPWRVEA